MESERQKKLFIVKVGVSALMILIVILWIFNLKNVWRTNQEINNTGTSTNWSQLKNDLDKALVEVNTRLNKIEGDKKAATEAAGASLIKELINKTEQLATSTATSTTAATTATEANATSTEATTSKTIKNNNCPAYINCMPTIGEARPCQIPAGCEGITQIAY
ncbi:MAG: hypothetical protein WC523_06485 [Patescibacteria group bacterium]|jgi:hypothetical protein